MRGIAYVSARRYWFPKKYADFVQRLRVPCGFLLLITFAWLSRPSVPSLGMGLPISVLGLLLRGWATGHLAKDQRLATSGPYAFIRNPLYAGTLIVAAGIVIASRDAGLAIIFATVFLLVYLPTIELEEQHLRTKFASYAEYAERVPRLIPSRHWAAERSRFSSALYLRNQEYKALIGFAVAVVWLIIKLRYPAVIRFR
ncbi:MAG: isoprenylcysteine carboxylmethyltransferase family protein [Acidobacteriaceae bacterium]|nr:isoprenylcysteine carboxylmethyltransferase family protein [Acidobacteriaceae bacterium]